ncbi:MAG: ribonuclease, partial [Candidatus Cloacimonas acidaminovorans]
MRKSILCLLMLIVSISIIYGDYFVNFEGTNETKTAYASGNVTLSGLSWNMTEALIGNLANDWKNGTRSARLRGYGTSAMTMLENKTNGLGTLSFYYRRYSTEAQVDWKVEYSVDNGSSWTQIGSPFTAPASDTPSLFSEQVNVSGNVRIRIKRATELGTTDRRLNI